MQIYNLRTFNTCARTNFPASDSFLGKALFKNYSIQVTNLKLREKICLPNPFGAILTL